MQQQCTTALKNAKKNQKIRFKSKNLIFSIFLIKNHDFSNPVTKRVQFNSLLCIRLNLL